MMVVMIVVAVLMAIGNDGGGSGERVLVYVVAKVKSL